MVYITDKQLNIRKITDDFMEEKPNIIKDKIIILVYGTLKKGFYNHHYLGSNKYWGEQWLYGFQMYTNGTYPAIVATYKLKDVIKGELYQIEVDSLDEIVRMEIGAGYKADTVDIEVDGEMMGVPLFIMEQEQVKSWKLLKEGEFIK